MGRGPLFVPDIIDQNTYAAWAYWLVLASLWRGVDTPRIITLILYFPSLWTRLI